MADVQLNEKFLPALVKLIDTRLGKAMKDLEKQAKDDVSEPSPPRSIPYDFPGRETGGFQDSLEAVKIEDMEWALVTNAVEPKDKSDRSDLGIWLELGNPKNPNPMKPRPTLIPTLVTAGPVLEARLGAPSAGN